MAVSHWSNSQAAIDFTWTPESYRSETRSFSKVWWVVLPLVLLVAVPVIARYAPDFFNTWLESEKTGLFEFIHAAFPLIAAAIGLTLLFNPRVRADRFLFFWVLAMVLGCTYLGGEEASWGQHYFEWSSPAIFDAINDQQETNLHNISSWFDQKPRAIVMFGMIVGGLLCPWLILKRPGTLPRRFDIIYPPLATVVLATIILLLQFYGEVRKDLFPQAWNGFRDGEWLETFMSFFLLYYAIFLRRRVKSLD